MELKEIQSRALEIRDKYKDLEVKESGKAWTYLERTEGLVGDTNDLMELVKAKAGKNNYSGKDLNADISHELSDVLWATLVLADELQVDLQKEFFNTMNELDERIGRRN